ncbi:CtsR family transcriptional regulator [Lapidilactobacillus bayanensis]|uniref:CtsR family transcriptional regulator n=1 Tax=Lapidilactobacillus bayanensis TaxID=2485998 RepID=UPI000F76DC77|nr:CtsR family transcriptional regulator [Lapidilactobacillus bayanensis]
MTGQNISDIIEAYLKQILAEQQQIEINRSDIAAQFNCVPSQINYVIKTRFNEQQGYWVESKRGGGGYIRIEKLQSTDLDDYLQHLLELVGTQITENDLQMFLQQLYDNQLLTKREAQIMAIMGEHKTLNVSNQEAEETLRANLLIALLNSLRYKRS